MQMGCGAATGGPGVRGCAEGGGGSGSGGSVEYLCCLNEGSRGLKTYKGSRRVWRRLHWRVVGVGESGGEAGEAGGGWNMQP